MVLEDKDSYNYRNATVCHICKKELGGDRIRNNCHITGKFRGAGHSQYNINFRVPKFFLVIFHNGSGYDFHLFIKKNSKYPKSLKCLPKTREKFISFSIIVEVYKFLDIKKRENNQIQKKFVSQIIIDLF